MKLAELGLKTKPATKYFDHGWVSFSTANKELYYAVCLWSADKTTLSIYAQGMIRKQSQYDGMMNAKTFDQVRESINQ